MLKKFNDKLDHYIFLNELSKKNKIFDKKEPSSIKSKPQIKNLLKANNKLLKSRFKDKFF